MAIGTEREKIFDSLAWWLHRHGFRPDHVTFLQIPVYVAMFYAGYRAGETRWLWAFFWLQGATLIIDGADGILARRTGTVTRHGHLLDAIFDIVGIGITLWTIQQHYPQYGSWLLGLLLINFLVYIQNEIQGTKSITYTRGPAVVAFVLQHYNPEARFMLAGILLPLAFGTVLLFTRVAWRKRFWTYYQFLTAGRRQEYKATPRDQRIQLAEDPRLAPPAWPRPGVKDPSEGDAKFREARSKNP